MKFEVRKDMRIPSEIAIMIDQLDPSTLALKPKRGNEVSFTQKGIAIWLDWFAKNQAK